MAKWIFTRENGPYSYPTLGFTADTDDVIEADSAPDAWWEEADSEATVTIPVEPEGGVDEPADGSILVYRRSTNKQSFEELDAAAVGAVPDTSTGRQALAESDELSAAIEGMFVERLSRYDIRDYGAVVDGRELTDVSMTAGSAVLDSASYTFTSDDIGKVVGVEGAGYDSPDYDTNANDGKLISSIVSVSGGNATLADVAVNTVSGAVSVFGTPDDDAIEAAQDAAVLAGGGEVFFPAGRTIVTRPLVVEDYVSWAGVHRDISWVDVIFSAPGTGPAVAGTTDWLSAAGRTEANPVTGASWHDFGVEARFHIRPGGYTAPIKALNIYRVKRCAIYRMNVWNTGATSIPFDHSYEFNLIAYNVVKNPGRLFDGSAGGSGIGIGTHNNGSPEPGLVIGNTIIGVGDEGTDPRGNNGIFVEGQGGSDPDTPSIGYRIVNNYVQGMHVGIAGEGAAGTIIENNVVNLCETGIRIADGGVEGAYPDTDALVASNAIYNSISPSGSANAGQAILVATNASDNVGVRARVFDNTIVGCAGRGIRVSVGTNPLDGLEISRNKIRHTARSGIHISASSGGVLTNPIIDDNHFSECGEAAVSGDVSGLYIDAPVTHPTIRDNTVSGSLNSGLLIASGSSLTAGGQITGNDFPVVTVSGTIDKTVRVARNARWTGIIDQESMIWVPVGQLATVSGTATSTDVYRRPALSLPDAATTIVAGVVALPADWREVRVEAVWASAVGSSGTVTWRCDTETFTTSTAITANPPQGIGVDAATVSDGKPRVTSVKTGIVVDNPFLTVNLARLGGSGNDTSPNPALLVGIRIIRSY